MSIKNKYMLLRVNMIQKRLHRIANRESGRRLGLGNVYSQLPEPELKDKWEKTRLAHYFLTHPDVPNENDITGLGLDKQKLNDLSDEALGFNPQTLRQWVKDEDERRALMSQDPAIIVTFWKSTVPYVNSEGKEYFRTVPLYNGKPQHPKMKWNAADILTEEEKTALDAYLEAQNVEEN